MKTRREKRRERRYLIREVKRLKFLSKYNNFNILTNFKNLYNSAIKASKGVKWKASVQRYLNSILIRVFNTQQDLFNRKDIRKGFIEFKINERGKTRDIKSVYFSERVVQKNLCKNILYPLFTRSLIYDNSASQKYKGTHFSLSRLQKHLSKYYRKYGNEGYILLIDFSKYFENIDHTILKEYYRKFIFDKDILKYVDLFVDAFGDKGLGLGSETSQLHAILFPNYIDHYIKEVLKIKYYGRYMDDSYILCNDKSKLNKILGILKSLYSKFNISINIKKTHIFKIKNSFTFLKTRFRVLSSGKILKRPCRKYITVERRKLKKLIKMFENNAITLQQISINLISWIGSMSRRNANKTIYSMYKTAYNRIYKA